MSPSSNNVKSIADDLPPMPKADPSAPGVPEMQALASVEISALDQLETPHFSNQQPLGVIEPLSPFQDSVIDYMSSTNGAPQFSFSDNDLSSPASTTDLDVSTAPTLPLPHPHYSAGLGMKFGLDLTVQAHLHSKSDSQTNLSLFFALKMSAEIVLCTNSLRVYSAAAAASSTSSPAPSPDSCDLPRMGTRERSRQP